MVFTLGSEEYCLDVAQVREIIRPDRITAVPKTHSWVEGIINLRGQVTTVLDLRKRLGLPAPAPGDATRIIIVEARGGSAGLVVDSVVEVLRIPRESLQPTPSLLSEAPATPFLRGIARAGGRILILLDLERILSSEDGRAAVAAAVQG